MNQNGFVSFMLEKDDSYQFQPTENKLKINNDDEFYRQLSQEFYGQQQQNQYYFKNNKKQIKTIDSLKFKSKPHFQMSESQKSQHSFTNQQQSQQLIQQKIYKLFTKQTPQTQTQHKQNDRSSQKTRNLNDITPQFTFKLEFSNTQNNQHRQSPQNSYRFKLNNDDYQGFQQQHSHRNTLNTSEKSVKQQDKISDIYYPLKINSYKEQEVGNLFQLSFRTKQ
ncbi:unnamed protein product (macronuclear) [Paramecium tetraurelia]|uniref:Uncharacterized protein n=1 Tax=Paramecium tetraurelia TaxID=5888 RepID=A0CLG5_PARTE|nr:uncharacterized protein GSPATT00008180001 [Paramecium tetraurelia]CAK71632.1 unnamed protein product [Paramecium tetraurelia]|eukprot:XP_001439029.1 hypothetical protein (macronuclear) [Paramecium tetraurelia strain d4-2]